jgi:hypothetical protein
VSCPIAVICRVSSCQYLALGEGRLSVSRRVLRRINPDRLGHNASRVRVNGRWGPRHKRGVLAPGGAAVASFDPKRMKIGARAAQITVFAPKWNKKGSKWSPYRA